MPDTICAAIRVGSTRRPGEARRRCTTVKMRRPERDEAWVRKPAGMRWSSRSKPIDRAEQRGRPTSRSASSSCVSSVRSGVTVGSGLLSRRLRRLRAGPSSRASTRPIPRRGALRRRGRGRARSPRSLPAGAPVARSIPPPLPSSTPIGAHSTRSRSAAEGQVGEPRDERRRRHGRGRRADADPTALRGSARRAAAPASTARAAGDGGNAAPAARQHDRDAGSDERRERR